MRVIEVRIDESALLRWHVDLLQRLAGLVDVSPRVTLSTDRSTSRWKSLERIMWLERRLNNLERGAMAPVEESEFQPYLARETEPAADVLIDLTADADPGAGSWTVIYDGRVGFGALVAALCQARMPLVSVIDGEGSVVATGRPGSEQPDLFASALSDITAGIVLLLVGAVDGRDFAEPLPDDAPQVDRAQVDRAQVERAHPELGSYAALALRRVLGALRYRVYRALYRAPHWRVGWSFSDKTGLHLDELLEADWQDLPDDGSHFYADPFPFEHAGHHFVFVEDFDHRVGKGVISVVEFDRSGPIGTPRPVLSHTVHLSYPFVFEHDQELWMIPETSSAGTVELYLSTEFPDRWELDRVLLEGIEASDVTVFVHEDRWWMMATVRDGGSFSDALHLWSAPDLRGPWKPHVNNPVLVDIASARPGGRVVKVGDRLFRPAQDGRRGYGAALTIVEILRLDDEGYSQRVIRSMESSTQWPGRRLHTLNEAGGLMTIDGSRMSPRWWKPRYLKSSGSTVGRL